MTAWGDRLTSMTALLLTSSATGHLLGVQCPTHPHGPAADPAVREMCDQYAFMASLINDKNDGFWDEIAVTVELTEELYDGGCSGTAAARSNASMDAMDAMDALFTSA